MNHPTYPEDAHPLPGEHYRRLPDQPVPVPTLVVDSTIETLSWLDEFLRRHASQAVHAKPDAFCRTQWAGGAGSANFVVDAVGLSLHGHRRAARCATVPHEAGMR